jgi:hypothetical protein
MKKSAFRKTAAMLLAIVVTTTLSAQNKAQDHNSSRSNKTASRAAAQDHNSSRSNKSSSIAKPNDGWNFGTGAGASFALKSSENTLFRGNSMASKMFGRYNFGAIGLGFNTGIVPGTVNSAAINSFLTERKFPTDAIINSTKPMNAYLLFGPSVNFGRRVNISADVSGGMFYNNAGGITIGQQGATRALYRFDAGSKNLFPGFSGTLNIAYPLNKSTQFFINTDYLQTTSSIRLLDPQRGIDVATEQNRTVQLFTAGVGIIKSFSTSRDAASGQATGKRNYEQVSPRDVASGQASGKFKDGTNAPKDVATGQSSGRILSPRDPASGQATGKRIVSPRDPASGLATGKRTHQQVSPRDPASGLATGKRSAEETINESCGPVTLKKTNPDGSVEEQNFSCPADAANYAKQTQGATFGEKVNQGLHAAGSALSQRSPGRNIIAGTVSWSSGGSGGIVTNQSAAVSSVGNLAGGAGGGAAAASYAKINSGGSGAAQASYASTGMVIYNDPNGVSTTIHTRDAASGLATGKRSSRDAASGLPTGRRQYQPVFFEGDNTNCTDCNANVKSNPLYKGNNNSGTNPLHKSSSASGNACNGVAGLKVILTDAITGAAVASTTTEACGEFYFANVPSGNYAVQLSGRIASKKSYDVYFGSKGNYDVAGEILTADDFWTVEIITAEGTPEEAAALLKTKTKSNQSNDRIINTSRSNIKNLAASLADADEDGVSEIWVGNTALEPSGAALLGGSLPGGAVISAAMRPGNPIGGLTIKGGKNPGGQMRSTSTNEYGEFEFTDWEEGNYTITAELNYVIADETLVTVGDEFIGNNINTTESNLKDIPPTANKGDAAKSVNNINGGMPNRISMNVTVPKQTQGTTFGEKVNAGMAGPGMRAQNNNTVRSNRTDNAFVIADLDGDGQMESSVLNFNGEVATITITTPGAASKVVEKATSGLKDVIKTQVRMAAGPSKWIANDNPITHVHGDPHVDQKAGTLVFEGSNTAVAKNSWQSSAVAVKAISCPDGSCAIITGRPDDFPASSRISLNGLPPGEPVLRAAVWFTDNKGNTYTGETDNNGRISLNGLPPGVPVRMMMNMSCNGTDDIIITFSNDAQGNAICNVLKTKHDTAKNSVGNIR